jgi:hypothetical protein
MSIVGFAILVSLVLLLIWLYTVLAKMPGEKARERNHPQAEAINVLGWIGLLLGVAPWLVALVWAHIRTDTAHVVTAAESLDDTHAQSD